MKTQFPSRATISKTFRVWAANFWGKVLLIYPSNPLFWNIISIPNNTRFEHNSTKDVLFGHEAVPAFIGWHSSKSTRIRMWSNGKFLSSYLLVVTILIEAFNCERSRRGRPNHDPARPWRSLTASNSTSSKNTNLKL